MVVVVAVVIIIVGKSPGVFIGENDVLGSDSDEDT